MNTNIKKDLSRDLESVQELINNVKSDFLECLNTKLEKQDFLENRVKVFAILEEKVDLIEVQNALNASQADISSRFMEFKEETRTAI